MSNLPLCIALCVAGAAAGTAGAAWASCKWPSTPIRVLAGSAGGLVGVAIAARAGIGWLVVADLSWAVIGPPLAAADLTHRWLPRRMVWTLGGTVLMAWISAAIAGQSADRLLNSVQAAAVALGFGFTLAVAGGLGMGDVRLAAVVGLYLGWYGWTHVLLGFVIALLLALAPALRRLWQRQADGLPFGPYLIAGALSAVPW